MRIEAARAEYFTITAEGSGHRCHCNLADRSSRAIAGAGNPVPSAGRCLSSPGLPDPRPLQPARGDARGPTDAGSPAERRYGRATGPARSARRIAGCGNDSQYLPRWRQRRDCRRQSAEAHRGAGEIRRHDQQHRGACGGEPRRLSPCRPAPRDQRRLRRVHQALRRHRDCRSAAGLEQM